MNRSSRKLFSWTVITGLIFNLISPLFLFPWQQVWACFGSWDCGGNAYCAGAGSYPDHPGSCASYGERGNNDRTTSEIAQDYINSGGNPAEVVTRTADFQGALSNNNAAEAAAAAQQLAAAEAQRIAAEQAAAANAAAAAAAAKAADDKAKAEAQRLAQEAAERAARAAANAAAAAAAMTPLSGAAPAGTPAAGTGAPAIAAPTPTAAATGANCGSSSHNDCSPNSDGNWYRCDNGSWQRDDDCKPAGAINCVSGCAGASGCVDEGKTGGQYAGNVMVCDKGRWIDQKTIPAVKPQDPNPEEAIDEAWEAQYINPPIATKPPATPTARPIAAAPTTAVQPTAVPAPPTQQTLQEQVLEDFRCREKGGTWTNNICLSPGRPSPTIAPNPTADMGPFQPTPTPTVASIPPVKPDDTKGSGRLSRGMALPVPLITAAPTKIPNFFTPPDRNSREDRAQTVASEVCRPGISRNQDGTCANPTSNIKIETETVRIGGGKFGQTATVTTKTFCSGNSVVTQTSRSDGIESSDSTACEWGCDGGVCRGPTPEEAQVYRYSVLQNAIEREQIACQQRAGGDNRDTDRCTPATVYNKAVTNLQAGELSPIQTEIYNQAGREDSVIQAISNGKYEELEEQVLLASAAASEQGVETSLTEDQKANLRKQADQYAKEVVNSGSLSATGYNTLNTESQVWDKISNVSAEEAQRLIDQQGWFYGTMIAKPMFCGINNNYRASGACGVEYTSAVNKNAQDSSQGYWSFLIAGKSEQTLWDQGMIFGDARSAGFQAREYVDKVAPACGVQPWERTLTEEETACLTGQSVAAKARIAEVDEQNMQMAALNIGSAALGFAGGAITAGIKAVDIASKIAKVTIGSGAISDAVIAVGMAESMTAGDRAAAAVVEAMSKAEGISDTERRVYSEQAEEMTVQTDEAYTQNVMYGVFFAAVGNVAGEVGLPVIGKATRETLEKTKIGKSLVEFFFGANPGRAAGEIADAMNSAMVTGDGTPLTMKPETVGVKEIGQSGGNVQFVIPGVPMREVPAGEVGNILINPPQGTVVRSADGKIFIADSTGSFHVLTAEDGLAPASVGTVAGRVATADNVLAAKKTLTDAKESRKALGQQAVITGNIPVAGNKVAKIVEAIPVEPDTLFGRAAQTVESVKEAIAVPAGSLFDQAAKTANNLAEVPAAVGGGMRNLADNTGKAVGGVVDKVSEALPFGRKSVVDLEGPLVPAAKSTAEAFPEAGSVEVVPKGGGEPYRVDYDPNNPQALDSLKPGDTVDDVRGQGWVKNEDGSWSSLGDEVGGGGEGIAQGRKPAPFEYDEQEIAEGTERFDAYERDYGMIPENLQLPKHPQALHLEQEELMRGAVELSKGNEYNPQQAIDLLRKKNVSVNIYNEQQLYYANLLVDKLSGRSVDSFGRPLPTSLPNVKSLSDIPRLVQRATEEGSLVRVPSQFSVGGFNVTDYRSGLLGGKKPVNGYVFILNPEEYGRTYRVSNPVDQQILFLQKLGHEAGHSLDDLEFGLGRTASNTWGSELRQKEFNSMFYAAVDEINPSVSAAKLSRDYGSFLSTAQQRSKLTAPVSTIGKASSFTELKVAVRKQGGITSPSGQFYSVSELEDVIDEIVKGELGLSYATKADGFRAKVDELLKQQRRYRSETGGGFLQGVKNTAESTGKAVGETIANIGGDINARFSKGSSLDDLVGPTGIIRNSEFLADVRPDPGLENAVKARPETGYTNQLKAYLEESPVKFGLDADGNRIPLGAEDAAKLREASLRGLRPDEVPAVIVTPEGDGSKLRLEDLFKCNPLSLRFQLIPRVFATGRGPCQISAYPNSTIRRPNGVVEEFSTTEDIGGGGFGRVARTGPGEFSKIAHDAERAQYLIAEKRWLENADRLGFGDILPKVTGDIYDESGQFIGFTMTEIKNAVTLSQWPFLIPERVLRPFLDRLAELDNLGLFHRDIFPKNVMVVLESAPVEKGFRVRKLVLIDPIEPTGENISHLFLDSRFPLAKSYSETGFYGTRLAGGSLQVIVPKDNVDAGRALINQHNFTVAHKEYSQVRNPLSEDELKGIANHEVSSKYGLIPADELPTTDGQSITRDDYVGIKNKSGTGLERTTDGLADDLGLPCNPITSAIIPQVYAGSRDPCPITLFGPNGPAAKASKAVKDFFGGEELPVRTISVDENIAETIQPFFKTPLSDSPQSTVGRIDNGTTFAATIGSQDNPRGLLLESKTTGLVTIKPRVGEELSAGEVTTIVRDLKRSHSEGFAVTRETQLRYGDILKKEGFVGDGQGRLTWIPIENRSGFLSIPRGYKAAKVADEAGHYIIINNKGENGADIWLDPDSGRILRIDNVSSDVEFAQAVSLVTKDVQGSVEVYPGLLKDRPDAADMLLNNGFVEISRGRLLFNPQLTKPPTGVRLVAAGLGVMAGLIAGKDYYLPSSGPAETKNFEASRIGSDKIPEVKQEELQIGETVSVPEAHQETICNPQTGILEVNRLGWEETGELCFINDPNINQYFADSEAYLDAEQEARSLMVPAVTIEPELTISTNNNDSTVVGNGELFLGENFSPGNLTMIANYEGIVVRSLDVSLQSSTIPYLQSFFNEAARRGYTLVVAYGYRSYETQAELHAINPIGAAPAGRSQHQTGVAFDIFWIENGDWNNVRGVPQELMDLAPQYGIVHPLPWDTPHFVVLDAVYPGATREMIGKGIDPNQSNAYVNDLLGSVYDDGQTGTKEGGEQASTH